jgi:hypothetical protein
MNAFGSCFIGTVMPGILVHNVIDHTNMPKFGDVFGPNHVPEMMFQLN